MNEIKEIEDKPICIEKEITEQSPNWTPDYIVKVATENKDDEVLLKGGIDFLSATALKECYVTNTKKDVNTNLLILISDNSEIIKNKESILAAYGFKDNNIYSVLSITPYCKKNCNSGKLEIDNSKVLITLALPLVTENGYNKNLTNLKEFYQSLNSCDSISFLKNVFFAKEIDENPIVKKAFDSYKLVDDIIDWIGSGYMCDDIAIPLYDVNTRSINYLQLDACKALNLYNINQFKSLVDTLLNNSDNTLSVDKFVDNIAKNKEINKAIFGTNSKNKLKSFKQKRITILDSNNEFDNYSSAFFGEKGLKYLLNYNKLHEIKIGNWLFDFIKLLSFYNYSYLYLHTDSSKIEKDINNCIDVESKIIDETKAKLNSDKGLNNLIIYSDAFEFVQSNISLLKSVFDFKNMLEYEPDNNIKVFFNNETFDNQLFKNLHDEYRVDFEKFGDCSFLENLNEDICSMNNVLNNLDPYLMEELSMEYGCDKHCLETLLFDLQNLETSDKNTIGIWKKLILRLGFLPLFVKTKSNKTCALPAWYNPITQCLYVSSVLTRRLMVSLGYDSNNLNQTMLQTLSGDRTSILLNNGVDKLIDLLTNLNSINKTDCDDKSDLLKGLETFVNGKELQAYFLVLKLIVLSIKDYNESFKDYKNQLFSLNKFGKDLNVDLNNINILSSDYYNKSNNRDVRSGDIISIEINDNVFNNNLNKLKSKDSDDGFILNDNALLLSPLKDNIAKVTAMGSISNDFKLNFNKGLGIKGAEIKDVNRISIEEIDNVNEGSEICNDHFKNQVKNAVNTTLYHEIISSFLNFKLFYLSNILKFMKLSDLTNKRAQQLRSLTQLDQTIDDLKTELSVNKNELNFDKDEFVNKNNALINNRVNSIVNKLSVIKNIPKVSKIVLDSCSNHILVYLKDHTIVTDTRTNIDHDLGPLYFAIPYSLSNESVFRNCSPNQLKWIPASKNWVDFINEIRRGDSPSCSNEFGPYAVVHGSYSGNVCLGDSISGLRKAIEQNNLTLVVMLMIQYAESMNENDVWGQRCHSWKIKEYDLKEYLQKFFLNKNIYYDFNFSNASVGPYLLERFELHSINKAVENFNSDKLLSVLFDLNKNNENLKRTFPIQLLDFGSSFSSIYASAFLEVENKNYNLSYIVDFNDDTIYRNNLHKKVKDLKFTVSSEDNANTVLSDFNTDMNIGMGCIFPIIRFKETYPNIDGKFVFPIFKSNEPRMRIANNLTCSTDFSSNYEFDNVYAQYVSSKVGLEKTMYNVDHISKLRSYCSNTMNPNPCMFATPPIYAFNILNDENYGDGLNVALFNISDDGKLFTASFFFRSEEIAEKHGVTNKSSMLKFLNDNAEQICEHLPCFKMK
jgi:hypothetical protein